MHQREGKRVGLDKGKNNYFRPRTSTVCVVVLKTGDKELLKRWKNLTKGKTTKGWKYAELKKQKQKTNRVWPLGLKYVSMPTAKDKVCKMSQSNVVKVPHCLPLPQTSFNKNRIIYHRPTASSVCFLQRGLWERCTNSKRRPSEENDKGTKSHSLCKSKFTRKRPAPLVGIKWAAARCEVECSSF